MKPREAMWLALRDFYANSWRLALVNAAVGAVLVICALAVLALPVTAVLVVAAGPVLAALIHCAVTVVRTGSVGFADAWYGLRLHWRRGLELAAVGGVLIALGILALRFYGTASAWPLAFLTLYVLVMLGIYQLVLWTLAIADPDGGLGSAARDAASLMGSRPGASLALGLALLLVNVVGIAAAVLPFLTLTIAYTFLATARFVLPVASHADGH
jgi:hypothetical protein